MGDWKRFVAESSIAARVTLPTFVVVHRLTLNPAEVGRIIQEGILVPNGQTTCQLEVGGQCVAKGRIIRRRGRSWFKVTEMAEGGAS
jgi:hypothetical protein